MTKIESYDAFLLVSFGGPEGRDEVLPFLENVLRGRNVPRQRMLEVAEHYDHFGGVSPINAQNRALLAALKDEFSAAGLNLPLYWGNRNWHPLLTDTLRQMKADGVRRAIAFFTSAFGSYSGCRQYQENIAARQHGKQAPYTIILVTHELNEAIYVGDRVVGLSQYWNWKERGHSACPGSTIVYDAERLRQRPEMLKRRGRDGGAFSFDARRLALRANILEADR